MILLLTGAEGGCTSPPPGQRLAVSTGPVRDCIEGCPHGTTFHVTGAGFPASAVLKVYLPAVDGHPELPRINLDDARTLADGSFSVTTIIDSCRVVADPSSVPGTLVLAVDDAAGTRLNATFVGSDKLVCRPPFAIYRHVQPCGDPLCPLTLTTDSATSIGVHWNGRDARRANYVVRYRGLDDTAWTTTRMFGGDVADVAINNLAPGLTYTFELTACEGLFGALRCDPWLTIGDAATT